MSKTDDLLEEIRINLGCLIWFVIIFGVLLTFGGYQGIMKLRQEYRESQTESKERQ